MEAVRPASLSASARLAYPFDWFSAADSHCPLIILFRRRRRRRWRIRWRRRRMFVQSLTSSFLMFSLTFCSRSCSLQTEEEEEATVEEEEEEEDTVEVSRVPIRYILVIQQLTNSFCFSLSPRRRRPHVRSRSRSRQDRLAGREPHQGLLRHVRAKQCLTVLTCLRALLSSRRTSTSRTSVFVPVTTRRSMPTVPSSR